MYEELQKRVDEKAAKADIVIGDTSSIIRGFYYGREDPDHGDLTLQHTILGKLSKYVHGELSLIHI